MKLMAQCTYCGYKWKVGHLEAQLKPGFVKCPHCNDPKIEYRQLSKGEVKINYYAKTKEELETEDEDIQTDEMYDNYL